MTGRGHGRYLLTTMLVLLEAPFIAALAFGALVTYALVAALGGLEG